jgi:hypothetical protein
MLRERIERLRLAASRASSLGERRLRDLVGSFFRAAIGDEHVAAWLKGGRNVGTVPALRAFFNDAMSAPAGRLVDSRSSSTRPPTSAVEFAVDGFGDESLDAPVHLGEPVGDLPVDKLDEVEGGHVSECDATFGRSPESIGPRDAANVRGPGGVGVAARRDVIVARGFSDCGSRETRTRRDSLACLRGPKWTVWRRRTNSTVAEWIVQKAPAQTVLLARYELV